MVIRSAPVNAGMPTLPDTHAWVWWVTADRRLSRRARRATDQARERDDLWLSLISVWEVAKNTGLHLTELTRPVLLESCRLPQPFHGDPADQILVATARERGATLVTRDQRIRTYDHVRSLW